MLAQGLSAVPRCTPRQYKPGLQHGTPLQRGRGIGHTLDSEGGLIQFYHLGVGMEYFHPGVGMECCHLCGGMKCCLLDVG